MKLLKKLDRRWFFFLKLFLPLLLVMLIPTVLISIVNYQISKKNLVEEVGASNIQTLIQTREAMDSIIASTENVVYQILGNEDAGLFLSERVSIEIVRDTVRLSNLIKFTEILANGVVQIDKVYLYSAKNKLMISSDQGIYRKLSLPETARFENLATLKQDEVWFGPQEKGIFNEHSDSIQMVKILYSMDQKPRGFIIIKLKTNELENLVEKIYFRKTGFIAIVDAQGNPILVPKHEEDVKEAYRSISSDGIDNQGYVVKDIKKGNEVIISYTTSSINQWRYISVLPTDELQYKSDLIRKNILAVCLFFMVSATLLSLMTARGIYNPVVYLRNVIKGEQNDDRKSRKWLLRNDEFGQINAGIRQMVEEVGEKRWLKEQMENHRSELKNYFLYRLATGDFMEEDEMERQCQFFSIRYQNQFIVNLLQIETEIKDFQRAPILNHIRNRYAALGEVYTFFEQQERIVLILSGYHLDVKPIRLASEMVINDLRYLFDTEVTLFFGPVVPSLMELKDSYAATAKALKYKFVLGNHSIIDQSLIHNKPKKPFTTEDFNRFRDLIAAENWNGAIAVLDESLEPLMNSPEDAPFFLKSMILCIADKLEPDKGMEWNNANLNFYTKFSSLEDTLSWIKDMLQTLDTRPMMMEFKNRLISESIRYLQTHFTKDPSLTELAEFLDVSVSHLSRTFSEVCGKTFKEYLTEMKIDKAKELLLETDLPIEQIAKRAGYNNQIQFARMFKKLEHVSAGEFRTKNKGNG